jgi:hypothetical protein
VSDELTVFISYRRADASADAGRLYDALRRRFGRENLFMDVDSLRPGEDWVDAVEGAVDGCDVLLAVIGPDWVGATDRDGELRLGNELDRVRLEIEAALKRAKPVIPVLVEGAAMPLSSELPESLRPLLRRHALRVSHQTFDSDLGALVRALRVIEKARHPHAGDRTPHPVAGPAPATQTPTQPKPISRPPAPPAPTLRAAPTPPSEPRKTPAPTPQAQPTSTPQPQPTPVQPVYTTPSQAYYTPAPVVIARPSGPSSTAIAVISVGTVALLVVLVLGVFALVAQPTPTPTPAPTPTPTATPTPAPTPTPTQIPTPTTDLYSALRAYVPAALASSCVNDTSLAFPALTCNASTGITTEYEIFPSYTELYEQYDKWLAGDAITREIRNCFDTPQILPCEGTYALGTGNPAIGRVAAFSGTDFGDVYWTNEPTLILGDATLNLDAAHTFDDLFTYWTTNAAKIQPAPSP